MQRAKDALGIEGEDLAARHLAAKGLRILARRARTSAGEIDLVALDHAGSEVVFIEVKTRRGAGFGAPEESITYAKRVRLRRSAFAWMDRSRLGDMPYRIDVIAVTVGAPGAPARIEHFENAVGDAG